MFKTTFVTYFDIYFFIEGIYKIILFGKVEGGVEGSSTYKVTVNEPPKGGDCVVKPEEGKPLDPYFNVSCKGFHDDDRPLQYEFFYTNDYSAVPPKYESLGSGLDPARTNFSLPTGLEKNDYKFKFRVIVTDNLGASKKFEKFKSMVTVSCRLFLYQTDLFLKHLTRYKIERQYPYHTI